MELTIGGINIFFITYKSHITEADCDSGLTIILYNNSIVLLKISSENQNT